MGDDRARLVRMAKLLRLADAALEELEETAKEADAALGDALQEGARRVRDLLTWPEGFCPECLGPCKAPTPLGHAVTGAEILDPLPSLVALAQDVEGAPGPSPMIVLHVDTAARVGLAATRFAGLDREGLLLELVGAACEVQARREGFPVEDGRDEQRLLVDTMTACAMILGRVYVSSEIPEA